MQPRTEELLYFLLWGAEQLARPTFRNLTESFEGWAYRRGFMRQLRELERRQLLERKPGSAAQAIYRLSEQGRLAALGGRDPAAHWARAWDGRWRLILFDIPEDHAAARRKLRRFLVDSSFGCLQKSVWISPDPLSPAAQQLAGQAGDAGAIMTWEGRSASGEADGDIAARAWDFGEINRRYERAMGILGELPRSRAGSGPAADRMRRWAALEKRAWLDAISSDPLLPDILLPVGYQGKKAWQARIRVLGDAFQMIQ